MSAAMKPVLEGITVLADDVPTLAKFYREALGMEPTVEEAHYVAFSGNALRFAIFSRAQMGPNTNDHPDYRRPFSGQAFELNFQCAGAAEVAARFVHVCAYGGTAVAPPKEMSWGHFTGFFADPEGNIHSLFADLSQV